MQLLFKLSERDHIDIFHQYLHSITLKFWKCSWTSFNYLLYHKSQLNFWQILQFLAKFYLIIVGDSLFIIFLVVNLHALRFLFIFFAASVWFWRGQLTWKNFFIYIKFTNTAHWKWDCREVVFEHFLEVLF